MVQALVREVDAELVQRVGTRGHVLRTWEIKETNEGGEVILAQALVDVLVQPG